MAAAAHRCRLDRTMGRCDGPFHGIRAILHVRDKNGAFQRLLEAGGGQVVQASSVTYFPPLETFLGPFFDWTNDWFSSWNGRPPYSNSGVANLCIMDTKQGPVVDMASLARNGVYCVPAVFLNALLVTPGKPDWNDAVVPEFQPFLAKMAESSIGSH